MGKKKDNQIIVKVICIIASFILWLYVANAENPERKDKITVPVKIENVDSLSNNRLALENDQKFEVTLSISGPMLDMNALKSSDFTLKADLSAYLMMLKKGSNRIPVNVDSKPDNIEILDLENLWVKVNLDDLMEKSVPVRVDIPISTKSGFTALNPIITPSYVFVSGPAQDVKNVTYVNAKTEVKDAEKDQTFDLPLQAYDDAGRVYKDVKMNYPTANIVIPVKKTKSVSITVNTKGKISNGMIFKSAEPSQSKVEIAGDANALKQINSIETEAIDLSTITTSQTVQVRLLLPNYISVSNGDDSISVKINVDKIKHKNVSKDIVFSNLGADYTSEADKSNVSLILSGPQSIIDSLQEGDIKCTADLTNLTDGVHTVRVDIAGIPDGIIVESQSPQTIKVTINKTPAVIPAQ